MWKWIFGTLFFGVIGFAAYDFYTSQYYDAPQVSDGDFLMAFKGDGLRAVMKGIKDERESRRYFSYDAQDVKPWFKKTWSDCRKPSENEADVFEKSTDLGPGGRLDAVCEIDADGDVFVRGWVVSVPDL